MRNCPGFINPGCALCSEDPYKTKKENVLAEVEARVMEGRSYDSKFSESMQDAGKGRK